MVRPSELESQSQSSVAYVNYGIFHIVKIAGRLKLCEGNTTMKKNLLVRAKIPTAANSRVKTHPIS